MATRFTSKKEAYEWARSESFNSTLMRYVYTDIHDDVGYYVGIGKYLGLVHAKFYRGKRVDAKDD
jgi:hypothetical protein